MWKNALLAFAAGCIGGLGNSIIAWAAGAAGLTAALDVAIAPQLTPAWLYPRIVWGGIWGLLLLLPVPAGSWAVRGLVFSLGPSLAALFIVFPVKTAAGVMGLGLGALTPLFVLAFNAVWGLSAAYAYHRAR